RCTGRARRPRSSFSGAAARLPSEKPRSAILAPSERLSMARLMESGRDLGYAARVIEPLDLAQFPVLVVDDEPDNLDAFRFNFKRVFKIHAAGGGEEALGVLKDHDVAVIVTDQRMPKMTGLEFLKAARAVRPDAVGIILTAFTDV